ncbi:hypothetical protein ATE67_14535 [Sphingopyxis sp. H050]|jgi:Domain of unknown function (DUF6379)|uniref:C-glycoside deglycosidase beta subunit domain-containing protein n=1 Tax=Sphingopyxis sp. H050 TaxID=1759072 RepID=UPI000735E961|nr:DUF6379 domain-containing protein [Sphingopyxis sp. H050]KTE19838.1 hypothetical protein ATE67_14535 [Sphingopyxis sp. H050]
MMDHRVVSDNGLASKPGGCTIDVRLPWYRALPLSTVRLEAVEIDGETIDPARVSFELEGEKLRPADLAARTDKWWYVLDSAFVHVDGKETPKGTSHDVAVTISFRPPYIMGLNRIVRTAKTLVAQ